MAEHIFDASRAKLLTSPWRRLLQSPKRILWPYLGPGMTVLDIGCGPGFFTLPAAGLVRPRGRVIAADVQQEMLDILKGKIAGTGLEKTIVLHRSTPERLGVSAKLDFCLAFYVMHEVASQEALLREVCSLLKAHGALLVAEPIFKVSRKEFERLLLSATRVGFHIERVPRILMSRAALLRKSAVCSSASRPVSRP